MRIPEVFRIPILKSNLSCILIYPNTEIITTYLECTDKRLHISEASFDKFMESK